MSRAGPARALEYRAVAEALAWSRTLVVQLRAAKRMSRLEVLAVEARLGPACKRRVMAIRGAEKPTLVQVIRAWWVRSFVYKLRGIVARTRRFGSSPAEASAAIVNTALGITVVDASGWDDLDRGGGSRTFLSRETAGGGRGVTHCTKVSDDWLTRGERAWKAARTLGGRRAMHKWMGTEIQEGRVGDKRGRWAVEELLQVRRPGGRGRRLEVEVQWKGGGQTSWESVTQLTGDLRKRAREMEREC